MIAWCGVFAAPQDAAAPKRVLFVGNRLTTANDVPGLVEAMSSSIGAPLRCEKVTFDGFSLEDHWNEGSARRAIAKGGWSLVVLQQGPSASRNLPFAAHRVSLDRASKTWHLFGSSDANDIVVASGSIGQEDVREARWKKPAGDVRYPRALAVSSDRVLALETRMSPLMSRSGLLLRVALLIESAYRTESRLWTIGGRQPAFAASHLDLRCEGHHLDAKGTTCAAFDGARTGFFAVDPATLRLTPLASVTGRVYLRRDDGLGWFSGWWDNMPVLLRPAAREAIRVAARTGGDPDQLARAGNLVAAAWSNEHESTVRLYSIE